MPQIIQLQGKNPYYYQQRDVTDYGKAEELDFIAAERYRKHKANLGAHEIAAKMAEEEGRPYLHQGYQDTFNPYNSYSSFSADSMEDTPDLSREGIHRSNLIRNTMQNGSLPGFGDLPEAFIPSDEETPPAGTPPPVGTPPAGDAPVTAAAPTAPPAAVREDMPKTISKSQAVLNPYAQPNIRAGTQTGGATGPVSYGDRIPAESMPEKQTVYQMKMVEEEEKNKANKMKKNRQPNDRPSYYGGE